MKYLLGGSLLTGTAALAMANVAVANDADFAARCNGPGVVKCVGFDNTTTDIVRGQNLHPDGAGNFRAGLDSTTRASGAGSLRFDLPPPPHAGANIAGRWSPQSNDGLGRLFGQNSVFYVQFRQRFSPEFITNTWDSAWKTVIFHYQQATCASLELTTQRYYSYNIPHMYTNCGPTHMFTSLDGTRYNEDPPLLLQQGDYRCEYGNINTSTCFNFVANEWLTFYYKITIGTWDQPNSTVEAWVARQGQGYRQFIRVPGMPLSCNADSCTTSPGRDQGYNNITLLPYMTQLSTNSGRAGVTSSVWYDELIVSTQPIPAPATGPLPQSPTNVRVN